MQRVMELATQTLGNVGSKNGYSHCVSAKSQGQFKASFGDLSNAKQRTLRFAKVCYGFSPPFLGIYTAALITSMLVSQNSTRY